MPNIKEVNGIEVTGWDTAYSALGRKLKQIEKLILADGTELYGCMSPGCTFTGDIYQKIIGHLKSHDPSPPKAWMRVADLTVEELLNMAANYRETIDQMGKERDEAIKKAKARSSEVHALEGKVNRRDARIAAEESNRNKEIWNLRETYEGVISELTEQRDQALRAAEDAKVETDKFKEGMAALKEFFGGTK